MCEDYERLIVVSGHPILGGLMVVVGDKWPPCWKNLDYGPTRVIMGGSVFFLALLYCGMWISTFINLKLLDGSWLCASILGCFCTMYFLNFCFRIGSERHFIYLTINYCFKDYCRGPESTMITGFCLSLLLW